MQDLHLHSNFSFDSSTNPEENIKACINKGIKIMAFTDHIDNYCQKEQNDRLNIDEYFSTIYKLRTQYDKIEILAGIEVGLAHENKDKIKNFIANNPFDFVIGSIHAIEFEDVWKNRRKIQDDPIAYFRKYYKYMLDSIKAIDNFSVLGHIDYIDRYMMDKSIIPKFEIYRDLIDEILKELIKTNRGIEINTAGFRNNLFYANPKDEILKRYKELGGTIVTIGSDSHTPDTCGFKIKDILKRIKDLGFKTISYFEEKKERKIKI